MATGKSFNLKNQKMTKESIRIFLGSHRSSERLLSSSYWTEKFNCTCQEKNHILFHCVILIWWTYADLEIAQEKGNLWSLGCRQEQKSIRVMDWIHKIYVIERKTLERVWQTRVEIDENSDNITSRSCMAWHIDKNLGKRTCIRETVDQ